MNSLEPRFTGVIPSDSYHPSELSSQVSTDSLSLSGLEEPTAEDPESERFKNYGTYLPDLNAEEDSKAKAAEAKDDSKDDSKDEEAGEEEEEDPEAVTAQVRRESGTVAKVQRLIFFGFSSLHRAPGKKSYGSFENEMIFIF